MLHLSLVLFLFLTAEELLIVLILSLEVVGRSKHFVIEINNLSEIVQLSLCRIR
jgi:hypothetical protein